MKKIIAILAFAALPALLTGCGDKKSFTPANLGTTFPTNPKKVKFEDLKSDWAWALTNLGDPPGDEMVAVGYSTPKSLKRLTMAINAYDIFPIKYAGEKTATEANGDYNPRFEGVTGPYWRISDGPPVGDGYENMLLLPESCRDGMLALTPAKAEGSGKGGLYDNHGHPAAQASDVAKIQALKPDRKVMKSELLATDLRGGRIALFQFNNTAEEGLLILAYIEGEKIITKEFTARVFDGDGTTAWRADADPDDICEFDVRALLETDEGLVIAFLWYGPEGINQYLLKEKNGKFIDFITRGWGYNHWENSWHEYNNNEQ